MFIVDLGCNVGETLLEFANQYQDAKILGVELDPSVADQARQNLSEYADRVEIIGAAVGWPSRYTTAYIDDTSTVSTIYGYQTDRLPNCKQVRVRVYTLDEILEGYPDDIDILKIDIEGEEGHLIYGGGEWMNKTKEILLECHTQDNIRDCTLGLEHRGFTVEPQFDDPTRGNHLRARKNNASN